MCHLREPLRRERAGLRAKARFGGPTPETGWLRPGPHLDEDIVIAGGVHDVIADEHEVGILIGQGPKPVIIFLPWNGRGGRGQGGTPSLST